MKFKVAVLAGLFALTMSGRALAISAECVELEGFCFDPNAPGAGIWSPSGQGQQATLGFNEDGKTFRGAGEGPGYDWSFSGNTDPLINWAFGAAAPGNYVVVYFMPVVGGPYNRLVLDFGLARVTAASGLPDGATVGAVTQPGTLLGTVGYMSPEEVRGEDAGPASDIFAFGCVLYEMLAGHPPFTGATAQEVLARHSMDAVPRLSAASGTIPAPIEDAVEKALAKVAADRFKTAAQFAAALVVDAVAYRRRQRRRRTLRRAAIGAGALAGARPWLWGGWSCAGRDSHRALIPT